MKRFFLYILLFLSALNLIILTSCNNEKETIKEMTNDFFVYDNIKPSFLYQHSSTLSIKGKAEPGCIIKINLSNSHGINYLSKNIVSDELGSFSLTIKTPNGSFQKYTLTISDYHEKFIKTYDDIMFGEVNLLLGEAHILKTKQVNEEVNYNNLYVLDATEEFSWKNYDENNQNIFITNIYKYYISVNRYQKMPIGFVNVLFDESLMEEWLTLEYVNRNQSVKDFLINNGKYYENPYQKGQMSYICNNILTKLYDYSYSNIIIDIETKDFENYSYFNTFEDTVQIYTKMYFGVIKNIFKSFETYNTISLIQTGSYEGIYSKLIQNIESKVSNYFNDMLFVPTYDIFEVDYEIYLNNLTTRFYDVVIGKKEVSEYANHIISETNGIITIEFSKTNQLISDSFSLHIYDENNNLIDFDDSKIQYKFNQIIIDYSYDEIVENEENEEETITKYYSIKRIAYGQENLEENQIIYNSSNLPIIPFEIIIEWR